MRRPFAAAVAWCAVLAIVAAVPKAASITDFAVLALTVPTTNQPGGLDSSAPTDIVLADPEGRVVLDLTAATGGVTGRTVDREPA